MRADMADNFSFRFTPTKEDFLKSYRGYQLRHNYIWLILGGSTLLEICLFLSILGGNLGQNALMWGLLIPLPAIFFLFLVWIPSTLVHQIEQNKERILSEIEWRLDDSQILIKNKFGESRFDWGTFQKVIETKDFFYLIYSITKGTNATMYQFIPKRVFLSINDEAAFREIITRKIRA